MFLHVLPQDAIFFAMSTRPKIIVLDDDPTGSQTVHSCKLLTKWDVPTIVDALTDASPIFFLLTNTRALTPQAAAEVTRNACHNVKKALETTQTPSWMVVSRSDSTLRGHYPIETNVISEELGPFDAHFLTPAFFAGCRSAVGRECIDISGGHLGQRSFTHRGFTYFLRFVRRNYWGNWGQLGRDVNTG